MREVMYCQDEDCDVEVHCMRMPVPSEFGGQLPEILERLELLSRRIARAEGIEDDARDS